MIRARHAMGLSMLVLFSLGLARANDSLSLSTPASVTLPGGGAGGGSESDSSTTVTNNGTTSTRLTFSITYQSGQPGGWLSASPSPNPILANGGTSTITITGNPARLNPATYTGFIVINGTNSHTATITVTFVVEGTTLSASPYPTLDFGSAPPGRQQAPVKLTGNANVAVGVTMNQGSGWLSTDVPTVTSPGTVNVKVDTSALSAGTYSGTVALQNNGGSPFVEQDVMVLVTVPALFSRASSSLVFSANAGTSPNSQAITVINYSSAPAPLTITPAGDSWLPAPSASPLTVPANGGQSSIIVSLNSTQLQPSSCPCQSSFKIIGPSNTLTYSVTLTISGVTIAVNQQPPSTINATAGQKLQYPLQVDSKGATLQVTFNSQPTNWLSVTPGTPAGTYQVSIDATGLTAGPHPGALQIACLGTPSCVAVTLNLTLNVTAPGVTASPTTLPAFQAYVGRGNPPSQSLSLTSSDGVSPVPFSVTNMPPWVQVTPISGTAGGIAKLLTVTANIAGLASSSLGTITITANSGAAATSVGVQVQVAFSPFTIGASAVTASVAPGGKTNGLLAVSTADGNSAAVTATASSTGNWLGVSGSLTAPGNLGYTIDATSLGAGPYQGTITLSCTTANPCAPVPVQVNLTVTPSSVVVSQILNATGEAATISQNTWVEIKGSNLSQTTRIWGGGDFVNGQMPTSLDNVSATVNGKPAYIYYISPVQINILTPLDSSAGTVPVQVKTASGTSSITNVTMQQNSLGFFAFNSDKYAAALHGAGDCVNVNAGTCYLGPTSLYPGLTTPAKPGETLVLYANGFGLTDTAIALGAASQSGNLTTKPVVTIGGLPCQVVFAGLVAVGQFQFNVVVPAAAPDGDNALSATYDGFTTHPGVFVTVQH
jgi:uncharacterized protein (TIGR03437 family)